MTDKFAAAAKSMEDAVAQAKSQIESLVKAQQEQFEKASAQVLKSYDEMTALAKENVDAVVQSGTIVAKGAEQAGKQVAAFTQSSFEKNVASSKALFAVKSLNELIELQSAFAKQTLDAIVAESTKLQELSLKVTTEAIAPINARVNATVSALSKPLAA